MGFSYRHRFLVPVILLSMAGIVACVVRTIFTGSNVIEGIVTICIYIAGMAVVCAGRRRTYRWITFSHFTPANHICYWLLLKLICCCIVVQFMSSSFMECILAGSVYMLSSVLLRLLLVSVRNRNAYGVLSHKESIHID